MFTTLGQSLRSPRFLFTKWPWLAFGYLLLGLILSWALSSVLLVLLVLSLIPAVRRAIWPTLVRLEGWRLTLVDPEGSATASTATGSGDAMAAAIAIAAAKPRPGIIHIKVPVTAAIVTNTSSTEKFSIVRHLKRNMPHDAFLASAHSSGGRKIGRINSGSMSRWTSTGKNAAAAPTAVSSTGLGSLYFSPTATARTVASISP